MKDKVLAFIEYLFGTFVILDGFSVYMTPEKNRVLFTALSLGCLIVLNLYLQVNKSWIHKARVYALCLSLFALIYFLQDFQDIVLGTVLFVVGLPLLLFYLYKCFVKNHTFTVLYRIENILYFLTLSSLILWLLGPLLQIIKPNMTFDGNWGAWTLKQSYVPGYWGLLFLTQVEDGTFLSQEIWRNTSIFAEGPMFNLWLCIGLSINLFLKPQLRIKRIVVYVVGIFSTFSSSGFIFMSIIGVYYLFSSGVFFKLRNKPIMKTFIVIVGLFLSYVLVNKVLLQKEDSTSYFIRMNEYSTSISCFLANPLFGVGLKNGVNNDFGMSNSLLSLLGVGGIWLFLIIYSPILYVIYKLRYMDKKVIGISLSFLLLTISTNFYTQFIIVLYPAILYNFLIFKKYE